MDPQPPLADPELTAVEAGGCAPPVYVARAPVARPALKAFLDERGIDYAEAARMIGGVSREGVRLWCLPFSDRRRRTPRKAQLARLETFSSGRITKDSFTPPETGDRP